MADTPEPSAVGSAKRAEQERQLLQLIDERDECQRVIDAILDLVLGEDRAEWSSAYSFADAINDVDERMAAIDCPPGWKPMPPEADDAMLDAAARASMQHLIDCINDPKKANEVGSEENVRKTHGSRYRSMFAACRRLATPRASTDESAPPPVDASQEREALSNMEIFGHAGHYGTATPNGYVFDGERQLLAFARMIEFKARAALSSTPATVPQRCPHCDDTGDVHSIDGEWRGRCSCPAGAKDVGVPEGPVRYFQDFSPEHLSELALRLDDLAGLMRTECNCGGSLHGTRMDDHHINCPRRIVSDAYDVVQNYKLSPTFTPVGEVLLRDPQLYDEPTKPYKVIDASKAFFDGAALGTQLYVKDAK